MKKFYSLILISMLMLTSMSLFSQNNFTTEWESSNAYYVGICQGETNNSIPEILVYENPLLKIYDGATKSLKHQYSFPDSNYFDWHMNFDDSPLDINHDGIIDFIASKLSWVNNYYQTTMKVIDGATGGLLFSEFESNAYIYVSTFDIDGDGYVELILIKDFPNYYKMKIVSTTSYPIAVESNSQNAGSFKLRQNYPNPFNPVTAIEYSISKEDNIRIMLYDETGQLVKFFDEGKKQPGSYKLILDGTGLASGVYFYQLAGDNAMQTRKMVLIK